MQPYSGIKQLLSVSTAEENPGSHKFDDDHNVEKSSNTTTHNKAYGLISTGNTKACPTIR